MSGEKAVVRGYELESNFTHLGTDAQWAFARKDGKDWFIKRFFDPVWPKDTKAYDAAYIEKQAKECKRFYERKRKLYDAVAKCDNGNVVTVKEFFMENSKYHVVTERVHAENIDLKKDISRLPEKEKYLLLRTITMNMMKLHEYGIVYADIRPDNILYKRSASGKLVAKLIDFDGSFFENDQPEKGIPLSEPYIAPETAELLFEGKEVHLTRKVDVFSLGLLFHLYWTGEMPDFDETQYDFACEALNCGGVLTVSPLIPFHLAALIRMMLLKNPADRPTMAQVFEELKAIQEGKPSTLGGKPKPPVKPVTETTTPPSGGFTVKINFGSSADKSGRAVIEETGTSPAATPPADKESDGLWSIPDGF